MLIDANDQRKHEIEGWGWGMAAGVMILILRLGVLLCPMFTAVVGSLMVIRGLFETFNRNIGVRGTIVGVLNVVLGIALAVILFSNPGAVLISLIWVAGIFLIAWGIIALIGAWKVNSARNDN